MNNDKLIVWFEKQKVGECWRDAAGLIGFRYDANWQQHGFPVSQQLPLNQSDYSPEEHKAHRFFANLLPEAGARMQIVKDLKMSNTDFDLLKALGGECAGALSILPEGYEFNLKSHYKKLSADEVELLIVRKGDAFALSHNKNRPRLSLAGAQNKCAVLYEKNDFYLPKGPAASSHILKFEVPGYRHVPLYECFLSKLAASIGLKVADTDLVKDGKKPYLLIKRFDRILEDNKKIKRIHQEDFCQALGVGYEKKYEADGGPSFADCYRLLKRISVNSLDDRQQLLQWYIFNVLAGNSDGHAKNLSLIYKDNKNPRLSPFYDLVCTRAIDRIDINLAMSAGGETDPFKIQNKHWETLAGDCEIKSSYLFSLIQTTAKQLLANVESVKVAFEKKYGRAPALQRVELVVNKMCKKYI